MEKYIKELESLSPVKLAAEKGRTDANTNTQRGVLIDNEIERRKRIHQHELDLKLIAMQEKSMKTSSIITAICTISGAVAGAILTVLLQWLLK